MTRSVAYLELSAEIEKYQARIVNLRKQQRALRESQKHFVGIDERRLGRIAVSRMTVRQRTDYQTFCAAGFRMREAIEKVLGAGWQSLSRELWQQASVHVPPPQAVGARA